MKMHENKKVAKQVVNEIFPPEQYGYKSKKKSKGKKSAGKKPTKSFLSPDLQKGLNEKKGEVVKKEIEAKQLI